MDTHPSGPPLERITANQVVAINMRRFRIAAGLTQGEVGERLGWTAAVVSAAERSADAARDSRRFDARELAEIAGALGVPLIALFLPPPDDGERACYLLARRNGDSSMEEYMEELVMPDSDDDGPAADAYRDALNAASRRYLTPDWADRVAAWFSAGMTTQQRADEVQILRDRRRELLDTAAALERIADQVEAGK